MVVVAATTSINFTGDSLSREKNICDTHYGGRGGLNTKSQYFILYTPPAFNAAATPSEFCKHV